MDDTKPKSKESDSLNKELDSVDCHSNERSHPPTKTQTLQHAFFIFLTCLFLFMHPQNEKKKNKKHRFML